MVVWVASDRGDCDREASLCCPMCVIVSLREEGENDARLRSHSSADHVRSWC